MQYNLKEIRRKKGYTRMQLSEASNVECEIITGLEEEGIDIELGVIVRLANVLKVRVNELLTVHKRAI